MHAVPHMIRLFSALDLSYCDLLFACDRLDRLRADITAIPDPLEYGEVLGILTGAMNSVRALEDMTLMPFLEEKASSDPVSAAILYRLNREHCEDICRIEEITEALESHACWHPILAPDAMRFMLRGFSTSLRRHIATERLLLRRWLADGEE